MSEPKPYDRLRFFPGRLLTAGDFALEQNYFRRKQKLHNQRCMALELFLD